MGLPSLARVMEEQNHSVFSPGYFNGNEHYEGRFYSYWYDSYPGSGYCRQFEEIVSGRQYSSITSGESNNINASRAK